MYSLKKIFLVEEMKMIFNEDLQVVKSARLLEEATLKETEVCEDEGFISGKINS